MGLRQRPASGLSHGEPMASGLALDRRGAPSSMAGRPAACADRLVHEIGASLGPQPPPARRQKVAAADERTVPARDGQLTAAMAQAGTTSGAARDRRQVITLAPQWPWEPGRSTAGLVQMDFPSCVGHLRSPACWPPPTADCSAAGHEGQRLLSHRPLPQNPPSTPA